MGSNAISVYLWPLAAGHWLLAAGFWLLDLQGGISMQFAF
jgi:hypothetical protein